MEWIDGYALEDADTRDDCVNEGVWEEGERVERENCSDEIGVD